MAIDRAKLLDIFERLGAALQHPTTLCLIGSAPAIYYMQAGRYTGDIDVWEDASEFDLIDLRSACETSGLIFNPDSEVLPEVPYIQLVAPGVVNFPEGFKLRKIVKSGNLTIVMPPTSLIAASKLTRAAEKDIEDIVWWLNSRRLVLDEIAPAVASLPNPMDREFARENIVLVELLAARKK